jgi:single-strand DNA-binding protein
MLNKCSFIGNLGADPETRVTADQTPVTNIRLACTERYKDRQGNKQEVTEWVSVAFFGKTAELAAQYLKKGSKVYVEGKMKTEKYEKDGQTRYSTKIIGQTLTFLSASEKTKDDPKAEAKYEPPADEDIPF